MPAFNFKTAHDFNQFVDVKADIQLELKKGLYCKAKPGTRAHFNDRFGFVIDVVSTRNLPHTFVKFADIKAYHFMTKTDQSEGALVIPKVQFTLTYQKDNDAWELSGPRTNYWMPAYILKRDGGIIAHLEAQQVLAGLSSAAEAGRFTSAIVFMKYLQAQVK